MKFLIALLTFAVVAPEARAVEVAFERDRSVPLVYVNLAVKAGAVHDPAGQSGITNFMGEMLLRGTKSRTKEQIDLELDQMGANLAIEVRSEALILRGAVLASQLGPFLTLMEDIVSQPKFPEHEIRKLKSEVVSQILEELGRDGPLAGRRFAKFLFNGHPYGKPVLGTQADVGKLTRDQIVAHYEKLFQERYLLIVGAGDASKGQIQDFADALAKTRPDKSGAQWELARVAAPQAPSSRRLMIVDKADRSQVQIAGGQIGLRMTDSKFFPLYVANHAFGGGSFQARLMVEIRVKRGWAYGAYSYYKHGLQPRSWQFSLASKAKDAAPALELSLGMIEDLQKNGLKKDEFDFAKTSLINSAGFMYNTPKKRVENLLLERTLELPDGFMKTYGDEMAKVTLPEANAALKDYFQPNRLTLLVLATAKDLKEPLAKAAGVPLDSVQVVSYDKE